MSPNHTKRNVWRLLPELAIFDILGHRESQKLPSQIRAWRGSQSDYNTMHTFLSHTTSQSFLATP